MSRRHSGTRIEIQFEVLRALDDGAPVVLFEDDEEGEEAEYKTILLEIEANFEKGEAMVTSGPADRWYPGSPDEMEIMTIHEVLPFFGPFQKNEQYSVGRRKVFIPWDGKLTEEETEAVMEELHGELQNLIAMAEDARAEAKYLGY